MKKLAVYIFLLYILSSCTKSETQYIDQDNKKETVNNKEKGGSCENSIFYRRRSEQDL
ncbi:hypothetical protein ACFP3I_12370 [Chryseobacterium arachidis]|uniref:hypothetical protein n=1 Tax=Chryseobacterium arachidis TaxID=1416778 RepID=UPI00361CF68D